jgi:23S rRNA pseudouridine2605 synthase
VSEQAGERLQKVLARAGVASRRACEELIAGGRVTVNGVVAELGSRVVEGRDEVAVDGVVVSLAADLVYLALHKPAGVISSVRDTRGRRTVVDLVPPDPRVFPVGRLDLDSSGLLVLTNDGEFANRIAHPRFQVPKTYVAEVRGPIDRSRLRSLARGVDLDDGPARAESVRLRASSAQRALVEVVVAEGRNRLVRRMLDAIDLDVVSLLRIAIGPLRLGRLPAGQWRYLKRPEVIALERSSSTVD